MSQNRPAGLGASTAGGAVDHIIVRYGPAPGDTEDAAGELHADFRGCAVLPLSAAARAAALDPARPEALVRLVAVVWERVTRAGHGHILVGACAGFEHAAAGPGGCGGAAAAAGRPAPSPRRYVSLYAVARAAPAAADGAAAAIDLGIDYRGGPGSGVRAVLFPPPEDAPAPPPEDVPAL